ncbi:class I SAM-dependent methyltransferase [Candidatus Kaiserbacteria bacterium]|nr:class I SAM-dependent methyltransferase [Candidatus Kaiserbacteria bacterium]
MSFLIALIVLDIALVCVAIYAASVVFPPLFSFNLDVPFVPTRRPHFSRIIEALEVYDGDVVYELGSGDGRFIMACARARSNARYVGIERNPFLHLIALWRRKWAGSPANVSFVRGDFFTTDFSDATRLYAYLMPQVMDALLPKFERECAGARLASTAFAFSHKAPAEVIKLSTPSRLNGQHTLYVYAF